MPQIELVITDFVEDAVDDSAFAISFQINGPGTQVQYLRVAFTDAFIEDYFKVSHRKDLAREEKRLETTKRELFIRWAIYRLERWLESGRQEQNLMIDNAADMIWTQKLQKGILQLASQPAGERTFLYGMKDADDASLDSL